MVLSVQNNVRTGETLSIIKSYKMLVFFRNLLLCKMTEIKRKIMLKL